MSDIADVKDYNNRYLIKLGPTTELNKPQISDERKGEMDRQHALSIPTGPEQYRSGALPLTNGLVADHMTDNKKLKPIPISEKNPSTVKQEIYDVDYLMDYNGMSYGIEEEASVVRYNRYEAFYPSKFDYVIKNNTTTTYTNPKLVIQLMVKHSQFVYGPNSYIKFKLNKNDPSNLVNFGEGSSANLFKSVNVVLPDGQQLDYCENVGMFNNIFDKYMKGIDYFQGIGRTKGYHIEPTDHVDDSYMIPLADIVPMFGLDSLLTPNTIDNLTITIEFETPDKAFQEIIPGTFTPNTLEYTVSDVQVIFDSYYIDFEFQQLLYKQKIMFEYNTYETIVKNLQGNQYIVDLDISKSRVYTVLARYIKNYVVDTDIIKYSNFTATNDESTNTKSILWKSNNTVYPDMVLDDPKDMYIHNYRNLNMLHESNMKLSYDAEFLEGDYCHVLNVGRGVRRVEGVPIDNSNFIRFYLNNINGVITDYIFNFFVTYTKRIEVTPIDPVKDSKRLFPTFKITE